MTVKDATDVSDILRRLANGLAKEIDAKSFKTMPEHVTIGVETEMYRLRRLSETLKPFMLLAQLEPITG